MSMIQYGQDIYHEIGRHTSRKKITPFNNWQLTKFTFNKEKYYLFVEIDSGITVVTEKIDKDEFQDNLAIVIDSFEYITLQQRDSIFNANSEDGFNLVYSSSIDSSITKDLMNYIQNNSQDLNQKFNFKNKNMVVEDKALVLSLLLMNLSQDYMSRLIETIAFQVNQVFPIKTKRPRANVKYYDLSPKFIDPIHWEEYLNKDISKNDEITAEIKKNNEKIIDQYLKNAQMDSAVFTGNPRDQLRDFTNNFLLSRRLRFVNSNLGDVSYYIWLCIFYGIKPDFGHSDEHFKTIIAGLLMMFNDFYIFLSRVGLVTQADSNRVNDICQQQFVTFTEDEYADENTNGNVKQMTEDLLTDIKQFNEKPDDKKTDAELADIVMKLMKFGEKAKLTQNKGEIKENKKRNAAMYEIRAKLKGFKPLIWRRFVINGNSSLETLSQALLLMFNAAGGHMYDLYNPKTDTRYENQQNIEMMSEWRTEDAVNSEDVKVSTLNEGDKLLLTYDYGDNWEIEVNVKKISYKNVQLKYPQIISGKGLGIIEDIGGVWSLQDYYDTPKAQLDPDLLDWIGDIDLDEFDKDGLNKALEQPPYLYASF